MILFLIILTAVGGDRRDASRRTDLLHFTLEDNVTTTKISKKRGNEFPSQRRNFKVSINCLLFSIIPIYSEDDDAHIEVALFKLQI